MEHHWRMLLAVLAHVLGAQSHRHVEIHLDGAALPVAPEAVLESELELGAIEGTFAGIQGVVELCLLAGLGQGRFGAVPYLVRAHALFWTGGELDQHLVEAEVGVHLLEQMTEIGNLGGDLRLGAENVGIVLHEAAHAHDAVERPRGLVANARAELGDAQRQIAVGAQALVENLDVARAVHGLDREGALLALGHEHVFLVLVPVARLLPQRLAHDAWGVDLAVAVGLDLAAHVVLQGAVDGPAVGVPEHHAGVVFLHVEELQLAPEHAVVALLGLFEVLEVLVQRLLVVEGGGVEALQHRPLFVAAPVGAGHRHELHVFQKTRVRHVGAAAEVKEISLGVDAYGLVRPLLHHLHLVGLALGAPLLDGL